MRRNNRPKSFKMITSWIYISSIVGLISIAAWLTHIVVCLTTARYVLLLAGAILPPIGVIHGIGVWFGFWP